MIKQALIASIDKVEQSKDNYVDWILGQDKDLDLLENVLTTDYPNEFEQVSVEGGYVAKSMQFLNTSNNKTYEMCITRKDDDNGEVFCELYEIENDPDEAYTEL